MALIVIVVAMLLVGFDLGVYIIGALVIWRFILKEEDHPLSSVITSESTTGIFGRLMPAVFTPDGWGNLGRTDPYLHGNR
jgi:hypothetical protein